MSIEQQYSDLHCLWDCLKQVDTIDAQAFSESHAERVLFALLELGNKLSWNQRDPQLTRNRFGRINYSSNKPNVNYIDFSQFSTLSVLMTNMPARVSCLTLLQGNSTNVVLAVKQLADNLRTCLLQGVKHYSAQSDSEASSLSAMTAYLDEYKISAVLRPNNTLTDVLAMQCDLVLLAQLAGLCRVCSANLKPVLVKDVDKRTLYTLARFITMLGEGVKKLSGPLRTSFADVSFRQLHGMRDLLAHAHHRIIGDPDISTLQALLEFMQQGLPQLDAVLTSIVRQCEEALTLTTPQQLWAMVQSGEYIAVAKDQKYILLAKEEMSTLKTELGYYHQKKKAIEHQKQSKIDPDAKLALKIERCRQLIATAKKNQTAQSTAKIRLPAFEQQLQSLLDKQAADHGGATQPVLTLDQIEAQIEQKEQAIAQCQLRIEACNKTLAVDQLFESVFQYSVSAQTSMNASSATTSVDETVMKSEKLAAHAIAELNSELDNLRDLLARPVFIEGRDLAVEYALGRVGQHFRDLENLADTLYDSLQNPTVKSSVIRTIGTRNHSVMHNVFEDFTADIQKTLNEATLPSHKDYDAMAEILRARVSKLVPEQSIALADAHNNVGYAYMRLNQPAVAEAYFRRALECSDSNYMAKVLGIDLPTDTVYTLTDHPSDVCSVAKQVTQEPHSGRILVNYQDNHVLKQRAALFSNLALSLAEQKKYAQADVEMTRVMTLVIKHQLPIDEDVFAQYINNYLSMRIKVSVIDEALAYLEQGLAVWDLDPQRRILLLLNAVNCLSEKGAIVHAKALLTKCIVQDSTSPWTQAAVAMAKAAIIFNDCMLLPSKPEDFFPALKASQLAKQLFVTHREVFVTERGDQVRVHAEECANKISLVTEQMAIAFSNRGMQHVEAASFSQGISDLTFSLTVQNQHHHATETTLSNLGYAHYRQGLAAKGNGVLAKKSLRHAIDYYQQTCDLPIPSVRFNSHSTMAFCYEVLRVADKAIAHAVEALLCYSELPSGVDQIDQQKYSDCLSVVSAQCQHLLAADLLKYLKRLHQQGCEQAVQRLSDHVVGHYPTLYKEKQLRQFVLRHQPASQNKHSLRI